MKYYIDNRGGVRAFDDGVSQDAIDRIASARGVTLTAITDDEYFAIINPPPTLEQVVADKLSELTAEYARQVTDVVAFTTGSGVAEVYQADEASQQRALGAATAYGLSGSVPDGYTWRAANNIEVPFTLDDLIAFSKAIVDRSSLDLRARFVARKDSVRAVAQAVTDGMKSEADGIAAVQEIVW